MYNLRHDRDTVQHLLLTKMHHRNVKRLVLRAAEMRQDLPRPLAGYAVRERANGVQGPVYIPAVVRETIDIILGPADVFIVRTDAGVFVYDRLNPVLPVLTTVPNPKNIPGAIIRHGLIVIMHMRQIPHRLCDPYCLFSDSYVPVNIVFEDQGGIEIGLPDVL